MAKNRLFIKEKEQKGEIGMSTTYSFDGKNLFVKWKRGEAICITAAVGDAFIIDCYGGGVKVYPLQAPKNRLHKLMWLCSFNKECRTTHKKEWMEIKDSIDSKYGWELVGGNGELDPFYKKYGSSGNGWEIVFTTRSDCGGCYHAGMYLDKGISNADIIEALKAYERIRGFYYPGEYVHKHLKECGVDFDF